MPCVLAHDRDDTVPPIPFVVSLKTRHRRQKPNPEGSEARDRPLERAPNFFQFNRCDERPDDLRRSLRFYKRRDSLPSGKQMLRVRYELRSLENLRS